MRIKTAYRKGERNGVYYRPQMGKIDFETVKRLSTHSSVYRNRIHERTLSLKFLKLHKYKLLCLQRYWDNFSFSLKCPRSFRCLTGCMLLLTSFLKDSPFNCFLSTPPLPSPPSHLSYWRWWKCFAKADRYIFAEIFTIHSFMRELFPSPRPSKLSSTVHNSVSKHHSEKEIL